MFWPETGGVTVYAYYPALTSWSIQQDQSGNNLNATDFVYASSGTTPLTLEHPQLTFYHQDVEVVINLTKDASLSATDFSGVTLTVNGYTARKPIPSSSSTTSGYCNWSTDAAWNSITPYHSSDTYTVLLPPYTMPTNTDFFDVTIMSGTRTVSYKLPQAFTMLPGHSYSYDVLLKDNGIQVELSGLPSITDGTDTPWQGTIN
jgi:hypothetical protein